MRHWFTNSTADIDVKTLDMPALLLDNNLMVTAKSDTADHLEALYRQDGEDIRKLVTKALDTNSLAEARIRSETYLMTFWLMALPQKKGRVVLAGRDLTMQDKVTEALMASRNMFRDMVRCSAEFGWEVDALGCFTYTGPGDIFGRSADDLFGRNAADFFWPMGNGPAVNPFTVSEAMVSKPVKVATPEGDRHYHFHVTPVFNDAGEKTAVRGVCRDVSSFVEQERSARQNSLRLSLQGRITKILQNSDGAKALLSNAVEALAEVLRAEECWVLMSAARGLKLVAQKGQSTDFQSTKLDLDEITKVLAGAGIEASARDESFDLKLYDQKFLAIRLCAGEEMKGLVLLKRDCDMFPWSLQERALLAGIADNLVVAQAQAQLIERLNHLSSSDELTGLMNRRALSETVAERLVHLRATGQRGTILFVDLDHFKEVNDTLGHAAGDLALKKVSALLQDNVRDQDCVARIGGDEFIIWLDTACEEIGVKKAKLLLDAMPAIRQDIGADQLRLSMSIGIVQSNPSLDHDLEVMIDIADHVMYEAKQKGKNTYVTGTLDETAMTDKSVKEQTVPDDQNTKGREE